MENTNKSSQLIVLTKNKNKNVIYDYDSITL